MRRDDPLDLRAEAHVEHPVGLVEDEHLHGVDGHEPALHQVVETARRGDEDVRAHAALGLRADRGAAVGDATRMPSAAATVASSSATWSASSRVGTSTSEDGALPSAASAR